MIGVVIGTGNDYISFQNTLPHFLFILVVLHVVQYLVNIFTFVFALFPWFWFPYQVFVLLVLFTFFLRQKIKVRSLFHIV